MTKDHKTPQSGSTAALKQKLHDDDREAALNAALLEHPSYLELQAKLTEAEEKATQHWDRMLRMQAETENMQRRVERDIANAHKYGLEKFISELFPVIDSLERALDAPNGDAEAVLEGVRLTLTMLVNVLEKFGVKQVNPVGELFNPEWHQAVSTQGDSTVQPNTILSVLQKGYLLNNRLIRPALVIVAKAS